MSSAAASPLAGLRCALTKHNPLALPISTWRISGTTQIPSGKQILFTLEGSNATGQRLSIQGDSPSVALLLPGRAQVQLPGKQAVESDPLLHLSHLDYLPASWLQFLLADPKTTVESISAPSDSPELTGFKVTQWVDPRQLTGPPLRTTGGTAARADLATRSIYLDKDCNIVRIDGLMLMQSGVVALPRTDRFSDFRSESGLIVAHQIDESVGGANVHIQLSTIDMNPALKLLPSGK